MRISTVFFMTIAAATAACGDDDATSTGSGGSSAGGSTSTGVGPVPTATLTITPAVVTEAPESEVTFTLSLSEAPGAEGVRVYVLGDAPQSLTQLDLFALTVSPDTNARPVGNLDFSGFTLLLTEPEVSVTIPSFDDGDDEDPVTVSYAVVAFDEVPWGELEVESEPAAGPYEVDGQAATLEYRDTP